MICRYPFQPKLFVILYVSQSSLHLKEISSPKQTRDMSLTSAFHPVVLYTWCSAALYRATKSVSGEKQRTFRQASCKDKTCHPLPSVPSA